MQRFEAIRQYLLENEEQMNLKPSPSIRSPFCNN